MDKRVNNFIYLGEEKDSITTECNATSPTLSGKDLIETPEAAYTLTYSIVSIIYGEDHAKNERPYRIKMLNNDYWEVSGSLREGYAGGVFNVLIGKTDGKVYEIWHDR